MDRPEGEPETKQRVRGPLAGGREVDRPLVLAGGLLEVAAPEVGLTDPELRARDQGVGRVLVDKLLEVQHRLTELPCPEALHSPIEQLLGGDGWARPRT